MYLFVCALGDFLALFAPVLRQIARYLPHHRSENASNDKFKTASNYFHLFTRNFSHPSFRKPTICLAAAIPALILASAVCAPIFFGVEK